MDNWPKIKNSTYYRNLREIREKVKQTTPVANNRTIVFNRLLLNRTIVNQIVHKTTTHSIFGNSSSENTPSANQTGASGISNTAVCTAPEEEKDNTLFMDEGDNADEEGDNTEDEDEDVDNPFMTEETKLKDGFLKEKIRYWSVEYGISHVAINRLLIILNEHVNEQIPTLPNDSRTLLRTPRTIEIQHLNDGDYWHQGLIVCLQNYFINLRESMDISLNINIDGLPIHNCKYNIFVPYMFLYYNVSVQYIFTYFVASKIQVWPILCSVVEIPHAEPLTIGVFCGETKPSTTKSFLRPFVDELKIVLRDGVQINGHKLNIRINCFICDSPARAMLKGLF